MDSAIKPTAGDDQRYQYRVNLGIDEVWVTDAIVKAGGYRIADKHAFPERVENCDYRIGNLFIELKILERDVFEGPERQQKIINFFEEAGLIDRHGNGSVDSTSLPEELKRKLWDITLNGVEAIVKKANRQIRSTAKHLDVTDFQGAILLVNKECESIEGRTLKRYAEWIIHKEKFSSLHHVLCFSAIPAVAPGHPPVIGVTVNDPKSLELAKTFDAIVDAFRRKVEERLGKKLGGAPDDLGPLSNIREDRTFTYGDTTVTFASGSRPLLEENRHKMKDQTSGRDQASPGG